MTMALTQTTGNVIPFNSQTNAQKVDTLNNARTVLDNLGSQISKLVQEYNGLKQDMMSLPEHPTKEQLIDLLERRKAAIQALLDAHKADIDDLKAKINMTDGATGIQVLPPITASLGQLDTLTNLQTQLGEQQAKMTALTEYYNAYKTAVQIGQTPPPIPDSLKDGMFGLSTGMIIAGIAAIVGIMYFFSKK